MTIFIRQYYNMKYCGILLVNFHAWNQQEFFPGCITFSVTFYPNRDGHKLESNLRANAIDVSYFQSLIHLFIKFRFSFYINLVLFIFHFQSQL